MVGQFCNPDWRRKEKSENPTNGTKDADTKDSLSLYFGGDGLTIIWKFDSKIIGGGETGSYIIKIESDWGYRLMMVEEDEGRMKFQFFRARNIESPVKCILADNT